MENKVLKWIEIRTEKGLFQLVSHKVFDDSDEGIDSIYNYSYVEPDDLSGKIIYQKEQLLDVLDMAQSLFQTDNDKYLPFGYLGSAEKLSELFVKNSPLSDVMTKQNQ